MPISGRSPGTGLLFAAMAALLLSGCVAAGVATVAAGAGLGVAFNKEQPETTASAAPPAGNDLGAPPAAAGQPNAWGRPAASSEPTVLVEPRAPVEKVEVQPIQ